MTPLPGTLPEPEIWARLVRALGVVDDGDGRGGRGTGRRGGFLAEEGSEEASYEMVEDDEELVAISKVFEQMLDDVDLEM